MQTHKTADYSAVLSYCSVYIEAFDGIPNILRLVIYSLPFQSTLDLLILFCLMKCFSKWHYTLLLRKLLFRNVRGKQLAVNVFPSAIITACSIVCFNSRTFQATDKLAVYLSLPHQFEVHLFITFIIFFQK